MVLSSLSRAVQGAWDIYREELGVAPPDVVLALRDAFHRSDVDGFWTIWSKNAKGVSLVHIVGPGPTAAGSAAFFGKRPATCS